MRDAVIFAISAFALAGIAAGSIPPLRMNRATFSAVGAILLVLSGSITLEEGLLAIDGAVMLLLFSMMAIVSSMRASGFFETAIETALKFARTPRALLAAIIAFSGAASALFVNDTVCILATPLLCALLARAKRDPVPYLIALGIAANAGSCATLIGNPQNMLIGTSSGLSFFAFFLALAPPSLAALLFAYALIRFAFPAEFGPSSPPLSPPAPAGKIYRPLAIKSGIAIVGMIGALFSGVPLAIASLGAAAFLFVTRRVKPDRIFEEVDFTLLVFFAGLFVITMAISTTDACKMAMSAVSAGMKGDLGVLAGASAVASNLVSNVPAVMLLSPLVPSFARPEGAWLTLALSSTFAGNLTLLGSVATLIVAEGASRHGIKLGFWRFFSVGAPLTLLTLAIGMAWIGWFYG